MKEENLETCLRNATNVCESCAEKNCNMCYMTGIKFLLKSLKEGKNAYFKISLVYVNDQPQMKNVYVNTISSLTSITCSNCPDKEADVCSECSISKINQLAQLILYKKIKSM